MRDGSLSFWFHRWPTVPQDGPVLRDVSTTRPLFWVQCSTCLVSVSPIEVPQSSRRSCYTRQRSIKKAFVGSLAGSCGCFWHQATLCGLPSSSNWLSWNLEMTCCLLQPITQRQTWNMQIGPCINLWKLKEKNIGRLPGGESRASRFTRRRISNFRLSKWRCWTKVLLLLCLRTI